jgi:hypothetical protein
MTQNTRGFRARLVALPNTPITLKVARSATNVSLLLTPAERGQPG